MNTSLWDCRNCNSREDHVEFNRYIFKKVNIGVNHFINIFIKLINKYMKFIILFYFLLTPVLLQRGFVFIVDSSDSFTIITPT